ncbi:RidA family protein [Sphaerisporangium rhizosphaerae]|uniref:RidA family protein n=1 Tax=Sphaerisporangium rhizosphaerae TaxID=2269375 RepID=A0ABW2P7G0_9ACTN
MNVRNIYGPAVSSQEVRARLAAQGRSLPKPWQLPNQIKIAPSLVRVLGNRVLVSGHVPIGEDGTVAGPSGKVGSEVDLATAQESARLTLLGIFADLERELGDLDRVGAWCRLNCMVNASPDFIDFPAVFNPASQLLLDAFGDEVGGHSRVAVGVAGLPWNMPVEIEAELELRG